MDEALKDPEIAAGTPEAGWAIEEAQAHFAEVLDRAATSPQTITCDGKPVAVIVGLDQWARKAKHKGTLSEFFQTAPEGFADLDFSRSKDVDRDIEL